jgi:YD repeat-containing protein
MAGSASLRSSAIASGIAAPLCALLLLVAPPASADIRALYDDLSRLVRVIREDGEAATYHYDAVGNILRITRESGVPQTTVVSDVSTSNFPRGQTTSVTFTGFNFSGAQVTATAGLTITGRQTDVDTLVVQVRVDPGATLGPGSLTIQTPYGTVEIAISVVGGPPVVTAFSPAKALAGMVVTVMGAEFDAANPANNVVRVNGVMAVLLDVTLTALRLRVPSEATTGVISVTTPAGTGTSGTSLTVGTLGPLRANVPTTDLLGYWTFDQDGRDDGDSFDLTLQGGLASTAVGATGAGLAFPGDASRVAGRPGNDEAFNFGGADFSYALWVKWNTLAGEQVLIEKCPGATLCGSGGWGFTKLPPGDPRGSNLLLAFPLVQSSPEPVVAGRWYHLAVTRAAGTPRMYINGAAVATAAVGGLTIPGVTDPLRIGEREGTQAFPMNGVIDEVGIWARALTATEVGALASVFNPGPPVITSLTPARAVVGMVVTVAGGEFDGTTPGNNTVHVNGLDAPVVEAFANALKIRVPAGATTGPVTVTTPWGTATSPSALEITSLGPLRASVPTTDLLAYWSFDQDGRDDADSLDLTLHGGLAVTAFGAIAPGLAFPGDPNQFAVRSGSDAALDFGSRDMSFALWVKWDSLAGEQVLIEKCPGASLCGGGGWGLTKLPPGPPGSNVLIAFPFVQSPPNLLQTGEWYHLAVTREGATARLYINGAEVAQAAVGGLTVPPVSDPLRIGERAGAQSFPMNGVIDEIGIWARALTVTEIGALVAGGPPP